MVQIPSPQLRENYLGNQVVLFLALLWEKIGMEQKCICWWEIENRAGQGAKMLWRDGFVAAVVAKTVVRKNPGNGLFRRKSWRHGKFRRWQELNLHSKWEDSHKKMLENPFIKPYSHFPIKNRHSIYIILFPERIMLYNQYIPHLQKWASCI